MSTISPIRVRFKKDHVSFGTINNPVTSGLVLHLDAGNVASYDGSAEPYGSGTTWFDVSSNNNDFTIDSSGFSYNSYGYFEMTTGGIIRSSSITSSTDCTCIFFIRTTDTQSLFLQGHSASEYLGAYRSNNKYYNNQVGSPTLFMDTSSIANLYDNIRDDQWHMIEFKGANLSSWTSIQFNKYGGYIFDNGDIGQIMIYDRSISSSESSDIFENYRSRYGI